MMMAMDLGKFKREQLRWLILEALNAGRPSDVNEELILQAVRAVPGQGDVTTHELRRELDYLETRKLAVVSGKNGPSWGARLTQIGIDLVEYTVDCDPGIARPPKYW